MIKSERGKIYNDRIEHVEKKNGSRRETHYSETTKKQKQKKGYTSVSRSMPPLERDASKHMLREKTQTAVRTTRCTSKCHGRGIASTQYIYATIKLPKNRKIFFLFFSDDLGLIEGHHFRKYYYIYSQKKCCLCHSHWTWHASQQGGSKQCMW